MTSLQHIQEKINQLTQIELQEFREWFLEYDESNHQMENNGGDAEIEYLEKRAKRGSREKFLEILSKVPDAEPEKFDRL